MPHVRNAELDAAVRAAPADDRPRLVYADWWQDRGDPRGALTALQIEAEKSAPSTDADLVEAFHGRVRFSGLPFGRHDDPRLAEIRKLTRDHGEKWSPRGVAAAVFRKGFVEGVVLDRVRRLESVFEVEPVRAIRVRGLTVDSAETLFRDPALARVRVLSIGPPVPLYAFWALRRCPHLQALEVFDLSSAQLSLSVAKMLDDIRAALPSVRVFDLRDNERLTEYYLAKARAAWGPRLREGLRGAK